MTDLSAIIAFIPEPQRGYVLAAAYALAACVTVSSVITAHTPAWAFKRWRALRVFSFIAGLAPRDGAGTVKLPFTAPLNPGALEELARLRAQSETLARAVAQVAPKGGAQ